VAAAPSPVTGWRGNDRGTGEDKADQEKIDAVRDDKDRSGVPPEGITQARKRLEWNALSIYQREGVRKTLGGAGLPVTARAQKGSEITFHGT
jgi:hypothetical protein